MKFLPHTTGANKFIATYEMVKTHIEQYVQKTYKHGQDIAEFLRELRRKDLSGVMPVRQMSTYVEASDERLRKIEQEGYDVLYTAEVQNYMDRKNTLETDKISTSLVECEHVKAKIGKALRADGLPRMWKKLPPARGQKGFLS